jgi:hypothetical protein
MKNNVISTGTSPRNFQEFFIFCKGTGLTLAEVHSQDQLPAEIPNEGMESVGGGL